MTKSTLFFAPCSILMSAETHIKTNLRSDRDPYENSRLPFQLMSQSLYHLFGRLMRESIVQFQV